MWFGVSLALVLMTVYWHADEGDHRLLIEELLVSVIGSVTGWLLAQEVRRRIWRVAGFRFVVARRVRPLRLIIDRREANHRVAAGFRS